MNKISLSNPVIDVKFLKSIIDAPNLIILDASMPSVGEKDFEIPEIGIPIARYIPWKKDFTDTSSNLPNMLPNEDYFTAAAQAMGINEDSAIVVYDCKGIYSSPRIYWMFLAMGHRNIAVLNGGLPTWKKENGDIDTLKCGPYSLGNFKANLQSDLIKSQQEVFETMKSKSTCVIDARTSGRFYGTSPEPRPELRGGHIPGSESLPYSKLIEDGKFLDKENLKTAIANLTNPDTKEIVFTCGSGITASILFLAAHHCGLSNLSVYDGSWSEWGLTSDFPVDK